MLKRKTFAVIAVLIAASCAGKVSNKGGQSSAATTQQNPTVFFAYDSSKLTEEGKKELDKSVSAITAADASVKFVAEGHCDERGTEAYNMALGKRRAQAVKNYLVKKGVKASKIRVVSYGESRPVDSGHNEEAWAKNRRAILVNK